MRLEQLLKQIPHKIIQGNLQTEITGVTEDSRKITDGVLFCCIKGQHIDGHELAEQAVRQGAGALLTERPIRGEIPSETTVILVKDTREATGQAAGAFYGNPGNQMQLIGITGTKGKTSLSYMLYHILLRAGIPCGLIGTNGSEWHTGEKIPAPAHTTPGPCELHQTLFRMKQGGCQAVVMEVSSIGMKEKRCSGLTFAYGIFTNFAPDHIGGTEHASLEEYFFWKKELFHQCRCGIVHMCDEAARRIQEEICQERGAKPERWIGYREEDGIGMLCCHGQGVEETEQKEQAGIRKQKCSDGNVREYLAGEQAVFQTASQLGVRFQVYPGEEGDFPVVLPMPGAYNVSNALGAIACAWELLRDQEETGRIQKGFENRKKAIQNALSSIQIPGRTEIIGNCHEALVIVDYAHNASGLEQVLTALHVYAHRRIICVFGCGGSRSKLRRLQMGEVSSRLADWIILTEDNSREEEPEKIIEDIRRGMGTFSHYQVILDRGNAIRAALSMAEKGDIVLIAGKGHEEYQERNGTRTHFSDRETAREWMGKRGKTEE